MEFTDNHYRTLARLITKHAWLYTEMIAAETIVCGCPSPKVAGKGCFGVRLMLDPKVSSQSPTKHFIIHSRKALLNGISPKENRSIPPLKYEYFYALVRDFPDLQFTINGGINTVDEVHTARMEGAHGVMVGRAACKEFLRSTKCTTITSFLEETLGSIPDSVLDAPISEAAIGFPDVFADAKRLLPPPYVAEREEELLYA
ncbi:hypothetical protein MIMGU_mgv11b014953mg [Erythranthe guttata]|uniref:DUS-like FMN-binding domain-containing protein n=1 Tax=Erythranthe guttata TaxID=4155 RepID=A0A022QKM9_ERYGU|nr:hypothetical protein MIMGU_mgv11b014953mg [Erythranthe guttata]